MDFCLAPNVKPPFPSFAVRILRGIKGSVFCGHFPQHIRSGLLCRKQEIFTSARFIGGAVGGNQQGIVIQHFFKVRHEVARVCGIPGKPKADVVKQPAAAHLFECNGSLGKRAGLAGWIRLGTAVLLSRI